MRLSRFIKKFCNSNRYYIYCNGERLYNDVLLASTVRRGGKGQIPDYILKMKVACIDYSVVGLIIILEGKE